MDFTILTVESVHGEYGATYFRNTSASGMSCEIPGNENAPKVQTFLHLRGKELLLARSCDQSSDLVASAGALLLNLLTQVSLRCKVRR